MEKQWDEIPKVDSLGNGQEVGGRTDDGIGNWCQIANIFNNV